jgi:IMP cyclohydrolase
MANPNGPYPGRQLFVGMTTDGRPAVAYLVTGRSPASRERKATQRENSVVIGPLGTVPYDPLRHYTGLKWDDGSGVIAVSNGIQTEAIYEAYRLLFNTGTAPGADFIQKLMEAAGAEPDSLHTPRIAGVITSHQKAPACYISIKRHDGPARAAQVKLMSGTLVGISTYDGNMENPVPFSSFGSAPQIQFRAGSARELAQTIFDMSEASHQGQDIRVCAVGAIFAAGKWSVAFVNQQV